MARTADYETYLDRLVVAAFETPLPATLYHYTSLEALRGIAQSQHLRFTHFADTADEHELFSAREVIARVAHELKTSSPPVARQLVSAFRERADALLLGNIGSGRL
jgi:hypothetical protein